MFQLVALVRLPACSLTVFLSCGGMSKRHVQTHMEDTHTHTHSRQQMLSVMDAIKKLLTESKRVKWVSTLAVSFVVSFIC